MSDNTIKVGIISLGCPKNQVDAELMLARVHRGGYKIVEEPGLADVVIINTCGFIESAKTEAIEEIMEMAKLKEEKTIKKIIVTGCLAERYQQQLVDEFPEVDGVIGIARNTSIVEAINTVLLDKKVASFGKKEEHSLEGERFLTTLPYYSYLRIADGCDNFCSYCAIPLIRGSFRSKPMESLVQEAKDLVDRGVKELIVIAQDTTRYGEDLYGKLMLPELLNRLCEIDGLHWIRIMYCYPERMTDELLDVMANQPKIVKYLEIPIQHCNSEVLSRMNRNDDEDSLRALFNQIRNKIPNITIRTTVITGMAGETEEQFNQLAEFLEDMNFQRLGAFPYSQEEDTPAATMENQVEENVRSHRADIIMQQQGIRMERNNQQLINTEITVLVEGFDKYAECYFGRSEADAPDIDGKVFFTIKGEKPTLGEFVKIMVTDVMDYDLIGELI